MKALIKFFGILLVIFLLVVWFFFDNIKGYYTFKEYCEKEGGLTVYEPLQKNVGWWAKDETDARFTASLDHIGFVRYLDKDNQFYDLKPIGPRNTLSSEYEVNKANLSVEPIYLLTMESIQGIGGILPGTTSYVVTDKNEKKLVIYKIFSYDFFNKGVGPMDTNQRFSCFDESVGPYLRRWKSEINSSFKRSRGQTP